MLYIYKYILGCVFTRDRRIIIRYSFELASQFGMESGTISARDIKKHIEINNFTWHELNDVKTIQFVPTKVKSEFGYCRKDKQRGGGPRGFVDKQSKGIIK